MTPLFERLTTAPDLDNFPPDQLAKLKKSAQARINAQKSTGPSTPEGKAKSALNARRHGYSGASVVIADEDRPAFDAHLDSYFASFAPQTQAEHDTIRRAAIAMWRADRLTSIETGIFDIETKHVANMVDVALENYELHHKLAYSFMQQTATEGHAALALCMRYLSAANRDFDRAIRTFYLMKENRINSQPAPPPQEEPQPVAPNPQHPQKPIHIVQQKTSTPNEPTIAKTSTIAPPPENRNKPRR